MAKITLKHAPNCYLRTGGAPVQPFCSCGVGDALKEIDQIEILKEFIRHIIKVHCWGIEEIDGGDAQDKALELGLIEAHIATEEDVDPEFDKYNVGDTIYRFTDLLKGEL